MIRRFGWVSNGGHIAKNDFFIQSVYCSMVKQECQLMYMFTSERDSLMRDVNGVVGGLIEEGVE